MAIALLSTKISIPPARAGALPRPRLSARLEDALRQGRGLVLVSAPPGFGKTVLVAGWVQSRRGEGGSTLPAAWLTLDRGDNDPLLFWRYVVAALRGASPAVGTSAESALEMLASQTASNLPFEALLRELVNDLAELDGPLVLVLDDYHVIESEVIHTGLNSLLDRLPPQVCVLILTRVDPPLSLARRRAGARLEELRAGNLRFNREESAGFLSSAGIVLAEEDLDALDQRTEGWAAGLQLAALSLRDCADRHAFIASFAGDDRYVVDYLLAEVLQQLPGPLHDFLLKTSILEQLNGALCSAILNHLPAEGRPALAAGEGESATPERCHQVLEMLERDNLFIVPLDSRRSWYRYHPLFADLLRRRLRRALPEEAVRALYQVGAQWYEQEGLHGLAIQQALAAPDPETAASILERHILSYFYRSETSQVLQWIKALPVSLVRARPLLCAVNASLVALSPPFPPETSLASAEWLEQAERALHVSQPGPAADLARGFILKFRAYLSRFRLDPPEQVIRVTLESLAGLPPEFPVVPGVTGEHELNFLRFRSALLTNLGLGYLRAGQDSEAEAAFLEARRIGLACHDFFNASASVNGLAIVLVGRARLPEAAQACRELLAALEQAGFGGIRHVPYSGRAGVQISQILLEWNRLEEAARVLEQNFDSRTLALGGDYQFGALLAQARLKLAVGDADGALDSIEQAEQNWKGSPAAVEAQRVEVWLALGQQGRFREELIAWAQGGKLENLAPGMQLAERKCQVVRARAQVAWRRWKGQDRALPPAPDPQTVLAWAAQQRHVAEKAGWHLTEIELLVVQALARHALGDLAAGASHLRRALELAEPGGFVRLFIDEGAPMQALLDQVCRDGGSARAYACRLLSEMGQGQASRPAPVADQGLVEPLSPRELEVLALMSEGASNDEIAGRLVIATSTAKKHVLHILEKLEVSNRSKAVNRARELGLLE